MMPTKRQLDRRNSPFKFTYRKNESWFHLYDAEASFHQVTKWGQKDVFGISIKRLIAALKACGYIALFLMIPCMVEAKEVVIPFDDFLRMVASKEHSDKTRNKLAAENVVLVKLKDEHGSIIKLQAQQIEACEAIVKEHERIGETEAQISKAVEMQLSGISGQLKHEQRLSRYKSEAFWIGLVVVGLWVVN